MRKDFVNSNFEEKEVVLRVRVPVGFDEGMERKIDDALADTLYDLGCELVDSKEHRDVSNRDEIPVNHVTIVRERLSENDTWADRFWVDVRHEPSVEFFKEVIQDYLRTPGGFVDIEATCQDFNWGDAFMYIPMKHWEDHGIYYSDDLDYLRDKGLVLSRDMDDFTFVVDQDEVLIPDDLEQITRITEEQANQIYEYMFEAEDGATRHLSESGLSFINDTGKYYLRDGEQYVGIDYSADYEGFVEEFDSLEECVAWLNYEIEVIEIGKEKHNNIDREEESLDVKIHEATVRIGTDSVVGIGAFAKDEEMAQGVNEAAVLRNRTLDVCYGIPGYEKLPLKEKNQLYDLVKKSIEGSLHKEKDTGFER